MSSVWCRRLPMAGIHAAEGRRMRAARLGAIKADIGEHLACRELTAGAVAGRHGITPRYVQRLFGQEGTTFSEFVLAQRLTQARRMLSDGLYAGWSITAIAFEAGFGDLSYFDRSFRRRYAASPSDVRKAALRGQLPLSEPASSFLDKSQFRSSPRCGFAPKTAERAIGGSPFLRAEWTLSSAK
jgi:AraC-like DNA-binding protein